MKTKSLISVFVSAFIGACLALIGGYYFLSNKQFALKEITTAPEATIETVKYVTHPTASIDFVQAAEQATPAVVHVTTSKTVRLSNNREQELLHYFFGHPMETPNETRMGSGSGVILSKDGYIVTNNHVVEGSDNIEIHLSNNKSYPAKVVGTDKDTDIALLKIEEKNLPILNFSNSDSVQIGEWVLAVGNPFNLSSTVTAGIVSAKGRSINIIENLQGNGNTAIESFIQTDAAINPGNSGGALVNTNGELIGINTAIATPTGTYAGYAFAVPSNIVAKVVSDLKNFGSVQRGYLGVSISSVTSELAKDLNLEKASGVLINEVSKGGAADSAKLQKGDIIVAINNLEVEDVPSLQETLSNYTAGNVITVSYIRKNIRYNATLLLQSRFIM